MGGGDADRGGSLCACSMVFFSRDGYKDLALLLFPAMLAVAALLLSRRYVVYAIATVSSAAVLIFLQVNKLNPTPGRRATTSTCSTSASFSR